MKNLLLLGSFYFGFQLALHGGILDQHSSSPADDNGFIVEDTQFLAQTFKVGMTGLLDQVRVEVARNIVPPEAPLIFNVRNVGLDGKPGSLILASKSIQATEISTDFEFFAVDLKPFDLKVTKNETLSLVLYSDGIATPGGGINPYAWKLGVYAGGAAFVNHPWQDSEWHDVGPDYGFQTYVEPAGLSPVPEPATTGLWAGGLLVGFVLKRVQRRRRSNGPPFREIRDAGTARSGKLIACGSDY